MVGFAHRRHSTRNFRERIVYTDQQDPEQLRQAIARREEAFRLAVVTFIAAGGSLERSQQLCLEVDREIDGPLGEVAAS